MTSRLLRKEKRASLAHFVLGMRLAIQKDYTAPPKRLSMTTNNTPPSTPSGTIPIGGLDTLLAAAHMIPLQEDVVGVLRTVRYCTLPLLSFQRACILIETPFHERNRLYSFDAVTKTSTCSRINMPPEQGNYEIFRQINSRLLNAEDLQKEFPAATKLDVFAHARTCLLLPLSLSIASHAALFFIWTDETSVDGGTVALCRVMSSVVASALTKILQNEDHTIEVEALRQERDHLNILVGIASIVASTLEVNTLLDMLAVDLRRFISVHDVALALYGGENTISLYCARSESEDKKSLPRGVEVETEKTLLSLFPQGKNCKLLRENALNDFKKTDPLAAYFLSQNDRACIGFALTFQNRTLGFLLLAHENADIFTADCTSVLSRIAFFVACAVHNAQEYAFVSTSRQILAAENAALSSEIAEHRREYSAVIGQSEAIRKVLHQVDMVAQSDSTVLLLGETGTGKELVAEAIHNRSQRRKRRMIKINCAAVPAGLLESELFGHEKGAFTGAIRQNKGRFELADKSTLLLDEIGDLPLELQPKLLRILQSREVERLGGHTGIPVDVRVIAATNQNLLELVHQKRFREDLYYRLNVFPIHLPPLRERREDIPLLAQYFMEIMSRRMKKNVTRIPPNALRWLGNQDWLGNVRELANFIERAVICSTGKVLCIDTEFEMPHESEPLKDSNLSSEDILRNEIIQAVRKCNGVISGSRGAAALLGIKRTTLNSRIKRLGLTVQQIMEGN